MLANINGYEMKMKGDEGLHYAQVRKILLNAFNVLLFGNGIACSGFPLLRVEFIAGGFTP